MNKEEKIILIKRIIQLEQEIASWGSTNSQSNPGAVMNLRSMKKQLDKLKKQLEI